jgi:hypothetical protein
VKLNLTFSACGFDGLPVAGADDADCPSRHEDAEEGCHRQHRQCSGHRCAFGPTLRHLCRHQGAPGAFARWSRPPPPSPFPCPVRREGYELPLLCNQSQGQHSTSIVVTDKRKHPTHVSLPATWWSSSAVQPYGSAVEGMWLVAYLVRRVVSIWGPETVVGDCATCDCGPL